MIESGENEVGANLSMARGGPIYVPNLVGPLTRVPDLEAALLHELEVGLWTELQLPTSVLCHS